MTEIQFYKDVLQAKLAELTSIHREAIAIERASDIMDEMQLASERELTTRYMEREAKLSQEVRAALARIEGGTYGKCVNCEEDIGKKRLNALPWTVLCIRCQQHFDGTLAIHSSFRNRFNQDGVLTV